ncbi:hypothetical protein MNBD_ACTINO01-1074 [hydrothermal vent metagenome]|uniref:Uncharacterized protein n=1 Tax=hydrothermal vent metagenome TaxID=652676 RepID=A0A3B0RYQ4_9ZZZZ
MMQRTSLMLLTLALVAAACTSTSDQPPAPETTTSRVDARDTSTPTSTAAPGDTTTTTIAGLIITEAESVDPSGTDALLQQDRDANDGTLSLEMSLDLFASIYGPLPGVTSTITELRPGDGSLAIRSVLANWDELDLATQDAVSSALAPGQRAETIALAGEVTAIRAQSDTSLGAATEAAEVARIVIEEQLGRPLGVPLTISVFDSPIGGDNVLADATPMRSGVATGSGAVDGCSIRVFPPSEGTLLETTMSHEVYHCYQFTSLPNISQVLRSQDWIIEGQAQWVGAEVGGVGATTEWWFHRWITSPATSLFTLDYAAVGFYWVLETAGIDLWQAMPKMIGQRNRAAVETTGADPEDIWQLALTSMIRKGVSPQLDLPADWDFTPVDVPWIGMRARIDVSPTSPFEQSRPHTAFSRTGTLEASLEGDVVRIQTDGAVGAFAFEGGGPTTTTNGAYDQEFCLNEDGTGCTCQAAGPLPKGTDTVAIGLAIVDPATTSLRITTRDVTPDDQLGFSDGEWEGTFFSPGIGITIESVTALKEQGDSRFTLSVRDGVVTGTFTAVDNIEAEVPPDGTGMPGGSGQLRTVTEGILAGSPCNPSFAARSISSVGTVTVAGMAVPLVFDNTYTNDPVPSDWVFNEAGPDKVEGRIINTVFPTLEASFPVEFTSDVDLGFIAFRISP